MGDVVQLNDRRRHDPEQYAEFRWLDYVLEEAPDPDHWSKEDRERVDKAGEAMSLRACNSYPKTELTGAEKVQHLREMMRGRDRNKLIDALNAVSALTVDREPGFSLRELWEAERGDR